MCISKSKSFQDYILAPNMIEVSIQQAYILLLFKKGLICSLSLCSLQPLASCWSWGTLGGGSQDSPPLDSLVD